MPGNGDHPASGSRRIRAELVEQGQPCGRKRVVRLMRQLGLSSRRQPHRTITTDSQHADPSPKTCSIESSTRRLPIRNG